MGSLAPALAAVAAYPHLYQQVAQSIESQAHRIAERTEHFIPRTAVIKALDERLAMSSGTIVTLEGEPGSGTTSLLCHLAATRGYPIWLTEDDEGQGLEALCAQILAMHKLPIALVPPAAGRDATTLERLLEEAQAIRDSDEPLVILIDRATDKQRLPVSLPFPARVPPGVVVVLTSLPQLGTTGLLGTRMALPIKSSRTTRRLAQAASALGRSTESAQTLAQAAAGSFLYIHMAVGMLQSGLLLADNLPQGLEALHHYWWNHLSTAEQYLATLLAAAGEPLEVTELASIAQLDPQMVRRSIQGWRGLIEHHNGVRLYHQVTRDFITAQSGDELAQSHASFVNYALKVSEGKFEQLHPSTNGYLVRQLARHAALSTAAVREQALNQLTDRAWIRARERHSNDLFSAAHDSQWVLYAHARHGKPAHAIRTAMISGTLTLLARTLPPDALAETLLETLAQGTPRDEAMRRVRMILEQLPEDHDKALVLRRLGEACYTQNIRAPAMRMLSEALDLEAPGLPRVWRDEREEVLVAFARAALNIDASATALGITAQINHSERRGLIETEVVRWLLERGQRTRAEEVAYSIGHGAMHEWAMAEVAVGHVRAGDNHRAEIVLSTLKTETAIAWALAELASDAAHRGEDNALDRVIALTNPRLRDRAWTLVSEALAAENRPDLALETALQINDAETRIRALTDLARQGFPNAEQTLKHASSALEQVTENDRAPSVAALASAQAACGHIEQSLATADLLPEGEERDRAQSRVAVALARNEAIEPACSVALGITDDDERDWALDEISRILTSQGNWSQAFRLAEQIADPQQRARTESDLVIIWARAGHAIEAHERANHIAIVSERHRALTAIVDALIEQKGRNHALNTLTHLYDPNLRSRYQSALAGALASHNELQAAHGMARAVPRPLDRARALAAIARHSAKQNPEQSRLALSEALRVSAALGRKETFSCLTWLADTFAMIGGTDLLLSATSALAEVDSWWTN